MIDLRTRIISLSVMLNCTKHLTGEKSASYTVGKQFLDEMKKEYVNQLKEKADVYS